MDTVVNFGPGVLAELIEAFSATPFFFVDFTKQQIIRLIYTIANADGTSQDNVAGICLVVVEENSREEVYAFRVAWDSSQTRIQSSPTGFAALDRAVIPEISPNTNLISVVEKGQVTWRQNEPKNGEFTPTIPAKFVFVPVFMLQRLIDVPNCTHIRFRKALVNTKVQRKFLSQSSTITPVKTEKQKFMNYIVESVPTFYKKWEDVHVTRITSTPLNDADVVAYDYGVPCPTMWDEMAEGGNICCYMPRNLQIIVAPKFSINIGVIVDALWANTKAKSFLQKKWKFYKDPVTLTFAANGKITDIKVRKDVSSE